MHFRGLVFDFQAAEDGDAADDELLGWCVGWRMAGLVAVAAKNSHAIDYYVPSARDADFTTAENHRSLNHGLVTVYFRLSEIDFAAAKYRRHLAALKIPGAHLVFAGAENTRAGDMRTVGFELLSGFKWL